MKTAGKCWVATVRTIPPENHNIWHYYSIHSQGASNTAGTKPGTNRKNCLVLEINEWGVGEGQVMVTE